jgi:hypothetical protein
VRAEPIVKGQDHQRLTSATSDCAVRRRLIDLRLAFQVQRSEGRQITNLTV